jgi:hypothetical protein
MHGATLYNNNTNNHNASLERSAEGRGRKWHLLSYLLRKPRWKDGTTINLQARLFCSMEPNCGPYMKGFRLGARGQV